MNTTEDQKTADHCLDTYEQCIGRIGGAHTPAEANLLRFFAVGAVRWYWQATECAAGEDPEATPYDPEGDDPERVNARTYLDGETALALHHRLQVLIQALHRVARPLASQFEQEESLRLELAKYEHIPATHSYRQEMVEIGESLKELQRNCLADRQWRLGQAARALDNLPPHLRALVTGR